MVRFKSTPRDETEEEAKRTEAALLKSLTVCRAHRRPHPTQPPYGVQDMPIRVSGEWHETPSRWTKRWHSNASRYEIDVMWTWYSYKAQLGMVAEHDVAELGERVAWEIADGSG